MLNDRVQPSTTEQHQLRTLLIYNKFSANQRFFRILTFSITLYGRVPSKRLSLLVKGKEAFTLVGGGKKAFSISMFMAGEAVKSCKITSNHIIEPHPIVRGSNPR